MDINQINALSGLSSHMGNIGSLPTEHLTSNFADILQNRLENIHSLMERDEILQACRDVEAYFIQLLWKEMRKSSDAFASGGILPRSNAEKIFQEMLDEENSKNMAKSGGIGIADMMYRQLTQHLNRRDISNEQLEILQ
jgi:flagellar protein FlgJ